MAKQPYIIGITGGSASGKSSFARDLKALFSDEEMAVVCEDNYYLPTDDVPVDGNGVRNFDTPDAIDQFLYISHVADLKAGKAIQKEECTFHKAGVLPRLLTIHPAPLIVLEGIFSIHFTEVRNMVDLKLYVHADPASRLSRRMKRDIDERGLDTADVEYRWKNHITPSYERDHTEYKECADVIILNNTDYKMGLKLVAAFLKEELAKSAI